MADGLYHPRYCSELAAVSVGKHAKARRPHVKQRDIVFRVNACGIDGCQDPNVAFMGDGLPKRFPAQPCTVTTTPLGKAAMIEHGELCHCRVARMACTTERGNYNKLGAPWATSLGITIR